MNTIKNIFLATIAVSLLGVSLGIFGISLTLKEIADNLKDEDSSQGWSYYEYDESEAEYTYYEPFSLELEEQILNTEEYIAQHNERQPQDSAWAYEKAAAEESLAELKTEAAYKKFVAEQRLEKASKELAELE